MDFPCSSCDNAHWKEGKSDFGSAGRNFMSQLSMETDETKISADTIELRFVGP